LRPAAGRTAVSGGERCRTTARPVRHRGRAVTGTVLVVCLAFAASACSALTGGSSSTYTLQANFSRGDNLFAPTPVKELGVPIGTVTSVKNEGDHVVAKMSIDRKYPLPAGARADVTQDTLLSQGFVQMSPGYTGGPQLPAGSVIPVDRTSVPATTDELLGSLNKFLGSINPPTASGAVTSLAQVLQGNGAQLNSLIHNASGTISLLAQKGNELGQLLGALGQLTGTLDKQNGIIGQFINNYNTVSGVFADNRTQLAGAINHLNDATVQMTALLQPNLTPIQQDVANLTSLSRGLDRNLNSLDESLYSVPHLFNEQGYDPVHNWEPISLGSGSGLTAPDLVAVMADRLASVCRRFLGPAAWNSASNTPVGCGDPNFFTPALAQFASILNHQGPPAPTPANAGPSSSPTAGQAFNAGLQQIPGLTPTQKSQITAGLASPPAPPPSGNSLSAPGANTLPAMPTAIQPAQSKGNSSLWPLLVFAALALAAIAGAMEAYRRFRRARTG
ncbi:MAG TPA: MCE family protein, partial [Acidimicrobiales bacterium]|nr:MCE family protein [Acidimicrobiales bacterium]